MGTGSIGDDAAPGRTRRHRVQPARPNRRDDLEQLRACYVSTTETPLFDAAARYGPFDFDSMQILAKNGMLVLC